MNQPTYPPQPNNSSDRLKYPSLTELIKMLESEVSKKGKDKMDKLLDSFGFMTDEDFKK
jgi:hypothetical protein